MKKTTIFLLTSLILIGCNNNENNSQSASLNETKNNYEITFNVTDFNGKALDNYTVKINNNDIKVKENKATIEQLQGSDKIEIESNGYLTNFYDGEELLKQNKKEIVYTVDESDVEKYTKKIEGYNITNTHKPETPTPTPETVEVEGTKTWDEEGNKDGERPEKIKIY